MAKQEQAGEVRFVTVAEVAAIMRVSKMTVYRLVHAGDLPAVRVGRAFRVPEQAVHDYLQTSLRRDRLRPGRGGAPGTVDSPRTAAPDRCAAQATTRTCDEVLMGSVIKKRRKRMAKKKHRKPAAQDASPASQQEVTSRHQ
ncbi:hypothetical protein GCM10025868_30600 [Angustibacter aerolatus]|uniref:Helix-turn-helix domain-containing protein n=1 Tax=Angustibacter aerolatus TaxID=1162965 RepID=A0ABQ6JHU6_9ACTN|nr:hypothetical protein GCM10025868_30600 [Angustibacter aerolatus]